MKLRRGLVAPAFVLLVVLWGSAFPVISIGLEYCPPVLFAGLRTLIGGAAMSVAALVAGGPPDLRRNGGIFALLTLLNVVLFIGLQTYTVLYLGAGTAAVLIYLQPILIGFLAWPILGERLTTWKLVGLLMGFSGILAVSSGGLLGAEIAPVGILVGAGAALSWALGTVCFKRVEARVSALWSIGLPFLVGGVVLMSLGLYVESPPEIEWSGAFLGSLLYVALVAIALAWVLWFALVRAGEASRVAAFVFFVPLVAIALGVVFLGEPLSPSLLAGAILVVAGIYLANRTNAGEEA